MNRRKYTKIIALFCLSRQMENMLTLTLNLFLLSCGLWHSLTLIEGWSIEFLKDEWLHSNKNLIFHHHQCRQRPLHVRYCFMLCFHVFSGLLKPFQRKSFIETSVRWTLYFLLQEHRFWTRSHYFATLGRIIWILMLAFFSKLGHSIAQYLIIKHFPTNASSRASMKVVFTENYYQKK